MDYLYYYVAIVLFLYILAAKNSKKKEKYLGKYTVPSYLFTFKYWLFYCLIKFRSKQKQDESAPGGYGLKSKKNVEAMENVQALSDHKYAIDAAYFNGYNKDGWYIGAGIQRRHFQKAESIMLLRVPPGLLKGKDSEADILEWEWGPATDCDMHSNTAWTSDNLNYEIVEPMKTWKVKYDGALRERKGRRILKVKYDLTWQATGPFFDFDTDMDIHPTCEAIATEEWSRDFFNRLKEAHQTHYEQFGILEGTIDIEGIGCRNVSFDSMRDRSYGKFRNWYDFNRYILQYFVLEDGTGIAFHLVNFSILMTHLITGFVITPDGQKLAITSSSKKLWEIGENEVVPLDYEIGITVQDGLRYHFKVHLIETPHYFCGWDWEAKLNCVLAEVECTTPSGDVKQGRGMCEFEYRHRGGRTDGRKPVPPEAMGR